MLPDEERDDLVLLVEVEDEDDVELEVDLHRLARVAQRTCQDVAAVLLRQDHVHQTELVVVHVAATSCRRRRKTNNKQNIAT